MRRVLHGALGLALFSVACGRSDLTALGDVAPSDAAGAAAIGGPAGRAPKVHRASAAACPRARGESELTCANGSSSNMCVTDADCVAGTNGRCGLTRFACLRVCTYDDCARDEDCGDNVPCDCRASASDPAKNTCLTGSNCRVDADCGPSGFCSPSVRNIGCSCLSEAFCKPDGAKCFANGKEVPCSCGDSCGHGDYCHTPSDQCVDDADCGAGGNCGFDLPTQSWLCVRCLPIP